MGKVLEFFRSKEERFNDVSDQELTQFIGKRYPEFFDNEEFRTEFHKHSSLSQPVMVTGQPVPGAPPKAEPGPTLAEQQQEVSRQADEMRKVYDSRIGMAGESPSKIAKAKASYIAGLEGLGLEVISEQQGPIEALGKTVGPPLSKGGKVLAAAHGDAIETLSGEPGVPNLRAFANDPEAPLPIQEELNRLPAWARIPGKVGQGVAHAIPRIGVAAGLGAAGAPHSVANLGAMAFDEEGEVDPIGVLAAVGLPYVDKLGREIAASTIRKTLARPILITKPAEAAAKIAKHHPALKKEAVQKALEFTGGQLANNAYLLALQTPGILQADNPAQALEDAVTANIALSLMGAGEIGRRPSLTRQQLAAKVERGEPIINIVIAPEAPPATPRDITPPRGRQPYEPPTAPEPPVPAPTPRTPPSPAEPPTAPPRVPAPPVEPTGPPVEPPAPPLEPIAPPVEPSITEGGEQPVDEPGQPVVEGALTSPEDLADTVGSQLRTGQVVDQRVVRMVGKAIGLSERESDEWAELAATEVAREIARDETQTPPERFWSLVNLYERMPSSTTRTAESKVAQQYSTPPPLAYAASLMADIPGGQAFVDPTAGHGMLSIAAREGAKIALNEFDQNRQVRLRRFLAQVTNRQGVSGHDATTAEFQSLLEAAKPDRLGMNPPFGSVIGAEGTAKSFPIKGAATSATHTKSIDVAIMLNSLQAMDPAGKAFAIIGAKTGTPFGNKFAAPQERANSYKRAALLDLFNRFNVVDWFTIGGELYKKMGAAWPVDVVIVHGKGKTPASKEGGLTRPWVNPPRVIQTWEELAQLLPEHAREPDRQSPGEAGRGPGGTSVRPGIQRTPRPGKPQIPAPRPEQPTDVGRTGSGAATPPVERPNPTPPPPTGVVGDSSTGIGTGTPGAPGKVAGGGAPAPGPGGTPRVGGQRPVAAGPGPAQPARVSPPTEGLPASLMVPYVGVSKGASLNLVAPRNIANDMAQAMRTVEAEVGKPLDEFVAEKLERSAAELHTQMAGAQIDAVALAIRNIERGSALIVADETGVGKGRMVAALIEYAQLRGLVPVFVTAKKNLYSDMVARDLPALGNKTFVPFITDTQSYYEDAAGREHKESRTAAQMTDLMDGVAQTGLLPGGAQGIFTTYDQLKADKPSGYVETAKQRAARKRKKGERPDGPRWNMLRSLAPKAIFIMDEAHLAAGSTSEVNFKFTSVLPQAKGMYFSSATFAKRPDNLGLYALGTSIKLSGLSNEGLTDALVQGGVPLQQALTSMLASSGELVRRQQDWTGVKMGFRSTSKNPVSEVAAADNYTQFIRDLKTLARLVNDKIEGMQDAENQVAGEEAEVKLEPVTFASRLFNLSNQYLLSLRSDAIVSEAVGVLKSGAKPFIALYNTMEGPITDLKTRGLPLNFNGILMREMQKMLTVTVKDPSADGGKRDVELTPEELADGGEFYRRLEAQIAATDLSRFPISPIDYIKQGIMRAGFTVGELTARDGEVNDSGGEVVLSKREKLNRNKVLKAFNDGDTDAIVVNGSGSTGLSAHTDPRFKDKRQRKMIVGQPAPDINEFMQMLGRVMRSGQTSKPEYIILTTALAAERRFVAMLRGKMTSLNANTTAEGESGMTQTEGFSEDVFNKVGDEVVMRVLQANEELAHLMDLDVHSDSPEATENFARYATGRFVLLPNADAQRLWDQISREFKAEVQRLDEMGQNPLRAVAEDLRAKTLTEEVAVAGSGNTPFDGPAVLERASVSPPQAPPTHEQALQAARDNLETIRLGVNAWLDKSAVAEAERLRVARERGNTEKQIEQMQGTFHSVRLALTAAFRKIGDTFGVDPMGENKSRFFGVAVDLKLASNDISDFASASRQELILRTNTYYGKNSIPLSKLFRLGQEMPYLSLIDETVAAETFNDAAEKSDTRHIVTGNLLRGWEYAESQSSGIEGRSRVAIYTKSDGSLKTGVLLPPGWKGSASGLAPVTDADEFIRLYQNQRLMRAATSSAITPVQVVQGRLAVPANNAAKVVWGDPAFPRFFSGSPQQVGGNLVGFIKQGQARQLFEFLTERGVRFAVPRQERVSGMRGGSGGGGGGQAALSGARGGFVSGVSRMPGQLPVEVRYGGMELVHPMEMPEIVSLVRQLTGAFPKLRKFPSRGKMKTLGQFSDGMVTLDPMLFKNPAEAAAVLLHEVGHLVDYLPHETLKRGNLLGHLLALRGFLRGMSAGKSNKELREELLAVTQWWRPYDEVNDPPSYVKYRQSAEELYADAFSVLFNAPAELEARAPKFYKAFWTELDRRPPVKEALYNLVELLNRGKLSVLEMRAAQREAMFFKGDEILKGKAAEREQRRTSWKGYWLKLQQVVVDSNMPIVRKVQEAEARGVKFSASEDPRNILEEGLMKDNVNARFVRRMFEGVVQPIEEAGITVTQLGSYLFLRRITAGDRSDLANPLGTTPATARLDLLKMRLDLGMDAMTRMERAVEAFHSLVFEAVEEAVAVGSYNKRLFERTIKPQQDVYAAFAVLDYLDDYIPASVKKQVGTLKEVANPFTATVLKTVTLNNLNRIQRSKNATRDLLKHNFPGEIEKAEGRFLAPGVQARPLNRPDQAVLEILEDGRRAYYYVDPLIARAFDAMTPGEIAQVLKPFVWVFRKGFYRAYITYSPSFLLFNPQRDFKRAWRNLPAQVTRPQLVQYYTKVFRSAVSHVSGKPDDLAREMVANFALGTPFDALASQHRDDPFADIMRRFHMLPEAEQPKFWETHFGRPIKATADSVEFFGQLQETLPKMAAYRLLREHFGYTPAEAAREVRNYIGTPNVFVHGTGIKVIRAALPFFNVFVQGMRADIRKMRPKSQSGWLFKWAISDGWFAVFSALASAGLLGAALEELFGGISEYDKTNYNAVPIGLTQGGEMGSRTHYLRGGRDEASRVLSGMTYKLTRLLAGSSPEEVTDLLDFGAGQMPTVNPAVQIPIKWAQATTGKNPTDPFRGRPIMSRTEHGAGGVNRIKPMFKWTMKQTGMANFVGWNEHAETTTEMVMSAIPGIKSIYKVSDYGHREKQMADETADQAARFQHLLKLPDNARSLNLELNRLRGIDPQRRTPFQESRYMALGSWRNSTYRKYEELVWAAVQTGSQATAQFYRKELERQSKLYERP